MLNIIIKEMQFKTTIRYHFIPNKTVIVKNKMETMLAKFVEIGILKYHWWKCKLVQFCIITHLFLKEVNLELLCDIAPILLVYA